MTVRGARHLRRQDGFTLIEMLESMVFLSVLIALAAAVLTSIVRQGGDVQEQSLLQTEVRAGVDRLAQDLRQGYSEAGAPAIEIAGPTSLQFLSPDRGEPLRMRRIAYRMTAGQLERAFATSTNTNGPPWTFPALGGWAPQSAATFVNPVVFTYFDSAGAVTAIRADMRSVGVRVVAELRTTPGRQFTYETTVTLRPTQ